MNCPNCHTEVPEGTSKCARCNTVFAKWADDNQPEPQAAPEKPLAALYPMAAAVALGMLGFWLFVPKKGLPLAEGSYEHDYCQFAIKSIPGWDQSAGATRPGECLSGDSVFGPPIGFTGKPVMAFGMAPTSAFGAFKPRFFVFVVPTEIPRIDESTLAFHKDDFWASMKNDPYVTQFKEQSSELISIDNLDAFKLTGTFQIRDYHTDFKLVLAVVPGRGRTYVLMWLVDAQHAGTLSSSVDIALWSFRVLKRPKIYSPYLKGAMETAIANGWVKRPRVRPLRMITDPLWGALKQSRW